MREPAAVTATTTGTGTAGTDALPSAGGASAPAPFFAHRAPGRGPGLAVFLNAGDPPLPVLRDLVLMLDEEGVDCLELAVPFPDSVTDGPAVRRSARRAMDRGGAGLEDVLAFLAGIRPQLTRTRIALLADWRYSLGHRDLAAVTRDIATAGADGLLIHALPPRLRERHRESAAAVGLPIVTTCYAKSSPEVQAEAAAHASAYLYLVAHYGRSGTAPAAGHAALARTVSGLRTYTHSPIAVGFGVSTRQDVEAVGASGADAAIIGSAAVSAVERAQEAGLDVTAAFRDFVRSVLPVPPR
ncbi:tryptophan synthase subunit alpha [Streptomyces sp. NPDC007172]|uniref:tryptophan synthase subunit alpha n=1 Tax=Streptomyces sp. NPDC007172 TaxID=3364776 RepID=UPI0036B33E3B